jgi:hypothetical protein
MEMRKQITRARLMVLATAVACVSVLAMAGSASAYSGNWARFNQCPVSNPAVVKCLQSVTKGGKVILGKKTVPIVNPVVLQGGAGESEYNEAGEEFVQKFYGAANGETLSKSPQPVPGGLSGLVNCKEISNFLVRLGCESVFENGLTGVNSTVELARPATEIVLSEGNLAFQEGRALTLPVKVHLENPLLGSTCYIGSSSSPLMWNLTTGTTKPPAPNTPISGSSGKLELIEGEELAVFNNVKLVDNAWSAPGATGCGGFGVELILNPIINASVGVPSAAGKNTAILENTTISVADKGAVLKHP